MVIRIKRKLYFKPRRCPVCRQIRLFVRCPLAKCCKKCHERQRRINRMAERRRQRKEGTYKYNSHYRSVRKSLIKTHPFCSLCGSETQLTVHHVGGGCEHYTVLCNECHQAYERWNNKRKAKKCIRRIGTRQIIKSIGGALAGMSWRIRLRLLLLRSSGKRFESSNIN